MNIPEGDKPWRDHLMGVDGCVKNPRRIQTLKKSKNNLCLFLLNIFTSKFNLDKNSSQQQQKAVVVPTSQVNVMKKPTTTGQKKIPTAVK